MKLQSILSTFSFTVEIILFVLTGILLTPEYYGYAFITLMCAIGVALYTGKVIEINAVEKYKENE